jgi:hypothetical protein
MLKKYMLIISKIALHALALISYADIKKVVKIG